MSYRNVNTGLTDQMVLQIQLLINQLRAMMPFLLSLNAEQKQTLPKIGRKRYIFSRDAYEFAQLYPGILPQNRSLVSYGQAKRDYEMFSPIFKNVSVLYRSMYDTMIQMGSNYYVHALATYDAVSNPTNDGEPGILFARDEMAKQFLTSPSQPSNDENTDSQEDVLPKAPKDPFIPTDGASNG